jgi:hypothetical protein
MSLQFNKRGISFVAGTMLAVIAVSVNSSAQSPLKYREILDALDRGVPEPELITQIEDQKIDSVLKASDSVKLVFHGASGQLMQAIASNRKVDKLPITFSGWQPFGGIAIAPWNQNSIVLCKGSSGSYPGLSTRKVFLPGNRTTLVVKVENTDASTFSDQNKMLKVFASPSNRALQCITDSLLAPDDRDYVTKRSGELRYHIPQALIIEGKLQNLGFQFGPGEYKTFKISAWFE